MDAHVDRVRGNKMSMTVSYAMESTGKAEGDKPEAPDNMSHNRRILKRRRHLTIS